MVGHLRKQSFLTQSKVLPCSSISLGLVFSPLDSVRWALPTSVALIPISIYLCRPPSHVATFFIKRS